MVLIRRVEEFLLMEEKDETNVGLIVQPKPTDSQKPSVDVKNITASWDDSQQSTLDDISIRVKQGQLCAIIGPVGSGKVFITHIAIVIL